MTPIQKVTDSGVTFQGRGANESLRIYLYPATNDGEWTSILHNTMEDTTVTSSLYTGRILYFRLKSTQQLTIKCSTFGKLKVL